MSTREGGFVRGCVSAYTEDPGDAWDVIVCGGGFAGMGAALAAARAGARTLLLEARAHLGGTGQICLWMPAFLMTKWKVFGLDAQGNRLRLGGVHDTVLDELSALDDDAFDAHREAIHPDYLRLAFMRLLEAAGCRYRLLSPVVDVVKEGACVRGVVVQDKGGRRTYRAHVIVDATGDADVAALAGAAFEKGRPEDGLQMPVTLTFTLGNVDLHRLLAYKPGKLAGPKKVETSRATGDVDQAYKNNPGNQTADDAPFYAIMAEARRQGYATATWYAFTGTTIPGVVTVNNGGLADVGNVDGTSSADLTTAERVGVQIATDFVRIARQWRIPGLQCCHLQRVGDAVAVRESRRVIGEHMLTAEDIRTRRHFADAISRRYEGYMDTVYFHREGCSGTGIPYRCLLPRGVDGLLVAGRCASLSNEAIGGARSMGTVMGMGQGAGVAAALAARAGVATRDVDVAEVQRILAGWGVLPPLGEEEKPGPHG